MKNITLVVLIAFMVVALGIIGLGLAYPPINETNTATTKTPGVLLTLSEAAKHNKSGDCWLVINKKVYNVSSYIGKHPGGSRTITSRCGQEVTGIFASIHSNFAWDLLRDYYIGPLGSEQAGSDSSAPSTTVNDFNNIQNVLRAKYPGAEIINVKPKNDFFVAKLIYNKSLYEIHVDAAGNISSEEVENDEYDWNNWDTDSDDN